MTEETKEGLDLLVQQYIDQEFDSYGGEPCYARVDTKDALYNAVIFKMITRRLTAAVEAKQLMSKS